MQPTHRSATQSIRHAINRHPSSTVLSTAVVILILLAVTPAGAIETQWANPVDGLWTNAAFWTSGVPTSVDNALIDATGSPYTVQLTGAGGSFQRLELLAPAATLNLDNTNLGQLTASTIVNRATIVAQQTSTISATFTEQSGTIRVLGELGDARLSLNKALTNDGLIELTSSGGSHAARLDSFATLTNSASGRITVLPGSGGIRSITLSMTNQGQVDIQANTSWTYSTFPTSALTNSGTVNVAAGSTLAVGTTFDDLTWNQNAGLLDVAGAFTMNDGQFNFNGGTVRGRIQLSAVNLSINPAGTWDNAEFRLRGGTIAGTIPLSGQVQIENNVGANAAISNSGRLTLSGSAPVLNSPNLTNNATGTLVFNLSPPPMSSANRATVNNQFTNLGRVEVNSFAGFNFGSRAFVNAGTIQLMPESVLQLVGSTIQQNSGSIFGPGVVAVPNRSRFIHRGGNVLSQVQFLSSTLDYREYVGGLGNYLFTGPDNNSILGDVPAGHSITIGDIFSLLSQSTSPARVTADGLVNRGTIQLGIPNGKPGELATNTSGLFRNLGTIHSVATAGLNKIINFTTSSLSNEGLLQVDGDLQTPAIINTGRVDIAEGATLTVSGNFSQERGQLNVAGTLVAPSLALRQMGGSVNAPGLVHVNNLEMNGAVSGNFEVESRVDYGANVSGDAELTLFGTGTLTGAIPSGHKLNVGFPNTPPNSESLQTTAIDVVNHGTLVGAGTLNATGFQFRNATSGQMSMLGELSGRFVNEGTMTLRGAVFPGTPQPTLRSGSTLVNSGTVIVPEGLTTFMEGQVTLNGGSWNSEGFTRIGGGSRTWRINAAEMNGAFDVMSAVLEYGAGAGGTANISVVGSSVTINGEVPRGHAIDLPFPLPVGSTNNARLTSTGNLTNHGSITLENTIWTINAAQGLLNTADGLVDLTNGRVTSPVRNEGTMVVRGTAVTVDRMDNLGELQLDHADLIVNQPTLQNRIGGTILGTGIIRTPSSFSPTLLLNSGTVSPGNSAGDLSISGSYEQSPTGILDIEIGGRVPGSQYDRLIFTGASLLDGTLNVSLIDGFVPLAEDSFTIVQITPRPFDNQTPLRISGQFDDAAETISFDGGRFDVTYTAFGVHLTNFTPAVPVPEPATVTLAVLGLAMLACRARKLRRN